jgi:hypothetical protein
MPLVPSILIVTDLGTVGSCECWISFHFFGVPPQKCGRFRMSNRDFGEIKGVQEGEWFEDRKELSKARVHRPRQAGICGGKYEGAESIVLSGGYEDDADFGDRIIYPGHGGNVPGKATQFKYQDLDLQNQALVVSCDQ